jgi:transcriptional regulator with XRE-family HTH domain
MTCSAMSQREAFGPNLRRIRLQRGVSLQQLATATKVSETLWDLQWQDPVPKAATGDRRGGDAAAPPPEVTKKSTGTFSTLVRRVLSRA